MTASRRSRLDRGKGTESHETAPPTSRRFVGREDEMAMLCAATDDALVGRGRFVLLSGDPGIGKSRTAEEVAAYARGRGARVLWGRCYESDGAPPFWPWVQVLRAALSAVDDARLQRRDEPNARRARQGARAEAVIGTAQGSGATGGRGMQRKGRKPRQRRLAVRLLFGNAVADVNCPFRLIRSDVLARFIDRIPTGTFAPNVAISGLLALERCRVANVVVPVTSRATRTAALEGWKAVATGLQALHQAVAIRRRDA
ncbi:MAG TPA: AAA family ATPase [Candidatus Acidoferrales bacterium]|nr:AAA family ATPase [Candidatus Acidoferrales bacterium]